MKLPGQLQPMALLTGRCLVWYYNWYLDELEVEVQPPAAAALSQLFPSASPPPQWGEADLQVVCG